MFDSKTPSPSRPADLADPLAGPRLDEAQFFWKTQDLPRIPKTGWWLTYPSEKYENNSWFIMLDYYVLFQ
jgi:hypothetical protein